MGEQWKSPRKVEEEIRQYLMQRFEYHYKRWENGEITREEMIQVMNDETNWADLEEEQLF